MSVGYCGPVCQRADWDGGHKAQCKKLAAERAAEEAAKEAAKGGGEGGGDGGSGKPSLDEAQPPSVARIPTGMDSRVTCWDCGGCGKAQDPKSALGCGGCRAVVYCNRACAKKHIMEHLGTCFEAVKARVGAGDVHKDDDGGEHVLKTYIRRSRRDFGDKDERTLEGISIYGQFLWRIGRLDEAEPLLREDLAGRRSTLGPKHPDTLVSVGCLAALLQAQGKLGEAEPLTREVIEICRATLGPKHPNTLSSMSNLAQLLQDQGKLGESEALLKETLEGMRATLGPRHPDTLATERWLAQQRKGGGKRK